MKKVGVEFLQRVNDGNLQYRELKLIDVVEGKDYKDMGPLAQELFNFAQDLLDGRFKTVQTGTTTEGKATIKHLEPLKEVKDGKGGTVDKEDIKDVKAPKEEKAAPAKDKKETKPKAETTVVKNNNKPSGKVVPYDRRNDDHKNLFSSWLDEEHAGWDDEDTVKAYSEASIKSVGESFLDADGEILQSFKDSFMAIVKA